jgi:hypothetical protein
MKLRLLFIVCSLFVALLSTAQNVGIGTASPQKLFSVNGSILLDQDNMNGGSLDSAALRFGTATKVGIGSNRSDAVANKDGLDIWTNNTRRVSVTNSGRVGINNTVPEYTLDVTGTGRFGFVYSTGVYSYANVQALYDLVAEDDLTVNDDGTILGNLGVGAAWNAGYRLRVEGNGLFTTNVGIDGTLRVDGTATIGGKITNEGKGLMLSNSATTLRGGFSSGTFSLSLTPGQVVDVTFCIPNFTGGNANVRPMISHFLPGTGAVNFGAVNMTLHTVDPSSANCGGNSSVTVRFQNTSGSNASLGTNAVLHLFTIVTD